MEDEEGVLPADVGLFAMLLLDETFGVGDEGVLLPCPLDPFPRVVVDMVVVVL